MGMEDVRERAPHPEQRQNHKLASYARRFSRSREHNSSSTVNQCQCSEPEEQKGKDIKGKDKVKDVKNESSKKMKIDDRRKCFYCNKTGHVRAECRQRLRDLAEAEGKPVAASSHPHDATAIVPLQCLLPGERHSSTFVIAMPCLNNKTSCEFSSEQTVRTAIPSNETCLMMDTCVGASIFPRGVTSEILDRNR